jgi:hypothetical protein
MSAHPRDKLKRVPYTLAKDRDTRNVFRKFSGQHPDRYNKMRCKLK